MTTPALPETPAFVVDAEALIDRYLSANGGHFGAMTAGRVNTTELVAALINQKQSFAEGIRFAQEVIEGSASILLLSEDGRLLLYDIYGETLALHAGRTGKRLDTDAEMLNAMQIEEHGVAVFLDKDAENLDARFGCLTGDGGTFAMGSKVYVWKVFDLQPEAY